MKISRDWKKRIDSTRVHEHLRDYERPRVRWPRSGDKKNNSRRRKDRWPIRSFRANNYCINYTEGSVRIYDVSKIQTRAYARKEEKKKAVYVVSRAQTSEFAQELVYTRTNERTEEDRTNK